MKSNSCQHARVSANRPNCNNLIDNKQVAYRHGDVNPTEKDGLAWHSAVLRTLESRMTLGRAGANM